MKLGEQNDLPDPVAGPGWEETERLAALERYGILDTPREPQFNDIVRLAADVFEAPIAVVNLIARGRQWFKAEIGIGQDELPLDVSICAHAILQDELMVVPDTTEDPGFACNPLVTGEPGLRFYAGALLKTPEGLPLGTVCVLDTAPRPEGITDRQRLTLEVLARQAMAQLELARAVAERDRRAAQLEAEIESRRDADQVLRETERRLNAVLDNTRMAVFLMDHRQQCVYANAAAETLTGYAFEDMQGRPLHDVVHHKRPDGSHYPLEECPIDRAFPQRAQMSGEELFVAPDGSFYPVAFTASPVLDDDGQPIGTVIEVRNIAEEKVARERLSQLAAVTEQSRDFIGIADTTGRPVFVNEAGRAMVGLPNSANLDVELLDFFAPAYRDRIATEALPTAVGGGYWEDEVRFRRFDDGREYPVLYNVFPVRDATGQITHYATVTRDLSEKRAAESALRELNETLEQRVAEAIAEREQAEEALRQAQKMEAVGQLTGGIAHDFNNMLAVVIGSLDLLGRRLGPDDPRARRYVDAATEGARRAALLTQRLLAFSRQQPLRPEPIDANRLVAGMSDILRHSLGGDVRLETVLAGGLWSAHADPNQLENAILNLAINARDAMPEGGRLTVETANCHLDARYVSTQLGVPAGQYVMIAITDTGMGMPPEIIAKAFDPFFTTKQIGKGTGLGLSQVYGFVKQSGGHVKIYSEPGQGTTIKIYLPRLLEDGQALEEGAASAPMPLGDHKEVVLVVEDEESVRQFSVDALTELGYGVLEADGAASALRLLDAHPEVALLFTDVVMPEVNGAKLAQEARRRRPGLRVLFTTGYTRNAVVHNGVLDAGVELIGKPFTIEELAMRVREVLDMPPHQPGR